MRKYFILLISICFYASVFSQDYPALNGILKQHARNNNLINLLNNLGGSEKVNASKFGDFLRLQLDNSKITDTLLTSVEKEFFRTNINSLDTIFSHIKKIGGQPNDFRVVFNRKEIFTYPIINIAKFKNSNTLVIGGLYYDYSFNKLRTDESSRIKEVLLKLNTPFLFNAKDLLKLEGIDNICVVSGFSNKDFTDKFDYGISETIAICFDIKNIKKMFELELTDEELVKLSDIFYTNKDMDMNLKKVTIN